MSRSSICGGMILLLCLAIVGCGPGPEEKFAQDQVALMNEMADAYEAVTDQKSYMAADIKVAELSKKSASIQVVGSPGTELEFAL